MKIFIRQGKESDQRGFYPIRLRCEGHGGADAPITLRHVHSDKQDALPLGHSEWAIVLVDGVHVAGMLERSFSGQGHYCGDTFHPTQGTDMQWDEGER